MATLNSLQVVLELNTNNFTTRVVQAGQQLGQLSSTANATATAANNLGAKVAQAGQNLATFTVTANATNNAVSNLTQSVHLSTNSFLGWTIALGEARHAASFLYDIFGSWIEKIISVNSHIEQTVMMMAGFSNASTQAERIAEGFDNVKAAMQLAASTPFRLDSIHDVFVKLKVAGLDPLNGALRNLSDAVAAFGGNDEKFKHAAYAIQDMAGKGVISMEELRRQLGQHIPNAMPMMARAMNVTVQELVAAVSKGTVESKHAIEAMFAEFDRTFSGAAAERMNTLSGAIAQVTTSLMHLSQVAGGNNATAEIGDSFYKTVIKGVKEFNDVLASPEMNSAAVRINLTLKGFADAAISLLPILPKLAENLDMIGKAFELLFAILVSKAIGSAFAALGSLWINVAAGAGVLVGGIRNLATSLPLLLTSLSATGASMAAFGMSIVTNVGIIGAAITGVSGTLAAFAVGLGVLAIPVAVIGGLTWLSLKLGEVKGAAAEAGDALRRLAMGDYSKGTQSAAGKELTNLRDKLAELQRNKDIADKAAADKMSPAYAKTQFNNVGGYLGGDDIKIADMAKSINVFGIKTQENVKLIQDAFKGLSGTIGAEIDLLRNKISIYEADLAAAPSALAKADAERMITKLRSDIAAQMQSVNREYDLAEKNIAERRKDAQKLPPDQRDAARSGLTNESLDNVRNRYEAELAIYRKMLDAQATLRDAALAAGNKDQVAALRIVLEDMAKEVEDRAENAKKAIAAKSVGIVTMDSSKSYETQIEKLNSYMAQTRGRLAQLNDVLEGPDGTIGSIAKLKAAFAETGQFGLIGSLSTQAQEAIKLQGLLEEALMRVKRAKEIDSADEKIANGYQKAGIELQAYVLKLTNPNMSEAQRAFALEQYRMGEALEVFMKNIDLTNMDQFVKMLNAANTAAATLNLTAARIDLSGLSSIGSSLTSQLQASLPPTERAIAKFEETTKKINDHVNAIKNNPGLTQSVKDAAVSEANEALKMAAQVKQNEIGRAGARASAPADNTVTQLIGRLEEMRAQAADTGSEYAKWLAILDSPTSRGKYEAQREQILLLAKDIDMMKDKVKLAQEAQRALDAIRHNKTSADNEIGITREDLMAGKRLDVEREIAKFRKDQENQLSRIQQAFPNSPVYDTAKADAAAAIDSKTLSAILLKTEANRTAEEQIRANFATTLSARRAAGEREIEFERSHMQKVIDATNAKDDELKRMQDGLNSYIEAKTIELGYKTENALQAQARDWKDIEANLAQFGAQAMDQFIDTMIDKLSQGKASWTDFANWAIKELLRVQMKAAMAPASDALGKVASGIGSVVGSFFGPSTPQVGQTISATSALQYGGYHTGGMIGAEPTFMRALASSAFNNAPRFHSGGMIGTDERPIVAQVGEAVFTPGQLRAIGNLNHNYTYMQSAIMSLLSAMNRNNNGAQVPVQSAISSLVNSMNSMVQAPASNDNLNTSNNNSGRVPVTINIDNQSSQPVSAVAGTPRFDGEGMVVDILLRNISSPGPVRSALKDLR